MSDICPVFKMKVETFVGIMERSLSYASMQAQEKRNGSPDLFMSEKMIEQISELSKFLDSIIEWADGVETVEVGSFMVLCVGKEEEEDLETVDILKG